MMELKPLTAQCPSPRVKFLRPPRDPDPDPPSLGPQLSNEPPGSLGIRPAKGRHETGSDQAWTNPFVKQNSPSVQTTCVPFWARRPVNDCTGNKPNGLPPKVPTNMGLSANSCAGINTSTFTKQTLQAFPSKGPRSRAPRPLATARTSGNSPVRSVIHHTHQWFGCFDLGGAPIWRQNGLGFKLPNQPKPPTTGYLSS